MFEKSVFLIKSPLQLLNAIEAKYYFGLNSDDCILIIMGDRKSQPQILMLANAVDEWGKVIVLNRVNVFFGDPVGGCDYSFSKKWPGSILFSKSFFNVRRLRFLRRVNRLSFLLVRLYIRHLDMSNSPF